MTFWISLFRSWTSPTCLIMVLDFVGYDFGALGIYSSGFWTWLDLVNVAFGDGWIPLECQNNPKPIYNGDINLWLTESENAAQKLGLMS